MGTSINSNQLPLSIQGLVNKAVAAEAALKTPTPTVSAQPTNPQPSNGNLTDIFPSLANYTSNHLSKWYKRSNYLSRWN